MDTMYVVVATYGSESCSWSENMCVTASAEKAQSIVDDLELAVMWLRENMPLLRKKQDELRTKLIGGTPFHRPPRQYAIDLIAYAVELGAGENELKVLNVDVNDPSWALVYTRVDASFNYEPIEVV